LIVKESKIKICLIILKPFKNLNIIKQILILQGVKTCVEKVYRVKHVTFLFIYEN